MSAIGDTKSKQYQLLRKQKDAQKTRMRKMMASKGNVDEIRMLTDVVNMLLSETQACLSGEKRANFN